MAYEPPPFYSNFQRNSLVYIRNYLLGVRQNVPQNVQPWDSLQWSSIHPPPSLNNSQIRYSTPSPLPPTHPSPPTSLSAIKMHPVPFYTEVSKILTFEFYCAPVFHFERIQYFKVDPALRVNTRKDYEVHLRMCLLDSFELHTDYIPCFLQIFINDKFCSVKDIDKPCNITNLVKYNQNSNKILLRSNLGFARYLAVFIVVARRNEVEDVCDNIVLSSREECLKFVQERLQQAASEDVSLTEHQCTLTCPLGKMRITVPCRSSECQHIQCFDAVVYLRMNEKRGNWKCPICHERAPIENLRRDRFMMDILEEAEESITKIVVKKDGTWIPHCDNRIEEVVAAENCDVSNKENRILVNEKDDIALSEDNENVNKGKKRILLIDLVSDDDNESYKITQKRQQKKSKAEATKHKDRSPSRKRAKHDAADTTSASEHRRHRRSKRNRRSRWD
ncbi:E3 SUMO-protein ligase pias1 [Halocaridina rubra]|uniref:E3 SUMO-protein ligase pias1 n=1 Tax=Halocaridina rubra TaxID=373956 RepID=A0AAN8X784_HALRR